MCKIIIEEENVAARNKLKTKLAEMFPEHEIVDTDTYKSRGYIRLEAAVDHLIDTIEPAINERLNRS